MTSSSVPSSSNPFDPPAGPEGRRRLVPDRRSRPTPRLSRYSLFGGRRSDPQRAEEREGSFVDVYSGSVLFWVTVWAPLLLLVPCLRTYRYARRLPPAEER